MDRDSSSGEDNSLIRSKRLFDSTIADGDEVMAKQLQRCVVCGDEQENCIQRRDGTWRCPSCIQEEWQKTKRRLVYRSELVAVTRKRFGKAR